VSVCADGSKVCGYKVCGCNVCGGNVRQVDDSAVFMGVR